MQIRTKMLRAAAVLFAVMVTTGEATAEAILSSTSTNITVGQTFIVGVNVAQVTDLYGFLYDLSFNSSVISALGEGEGSFLASGGTTFFTEGTIFNSLGLINLTADTLIGSIPGVSGSGTLVNILFQAEQPGTSPLLLFNATLVNSNLSNISFSIDNGTVDVSSSTVPDPGSLSLVLLGLTLVGYRHNKMRVRLRV